MAFGPTRAFCSEVSAQGCRISTSLVRTEIAVKAVYQCVGTSSSSTCSMIASSISAIRSSLVRT
ncbi:hypothetical protein D5S17_02725 [Pseudonocardiaceae bacterium YIM PH 21723]|nr:hypothetical protein D5S17_02725 [Pseudonocardiaceae bacterium YIM PH 21723]